MGRSSMTSSGWSKLGRTSSPPTALFYKMDRELYAKLQKAGYELIIDEVLETVTIYKGLDPDDLQVMLE